MADTTAKITAVIDGVTMTIAEVAIKDISSLATGVAFPNQTLSMSLTKPIKVDAGTNILLDCATSASGLMSACVHYTIENY